MVKDKWEIRFGIEEFRSYSLKILEVFVDETEDKALDIVKQFDEKKDNLDVLCAHPDLWYSQIYRYYKWIDLDEFGWNIFFKKIPDLIRRSAFLVLYSFFERELKDICLNYEKSLEMKINYNDIIWKGIYKSSIYLEKVIEIKIKEVHSREKIKIIQKIRNMLVHNDWEIICDEKDKKSIKIFIKNNYPKITIDGDRIEINEGFLKYTLDTFNSFFKEVESNNGFSESFIESISHTFWKNDKDLI